MKKIAVFLVCIICVICVPSEHFVKSICAETTVTDESGNEIPEIDTDREVEDDPEILVED